MPDTLFHGGPCDGQHVDVDEADAADGYVVCRGTSYRVYSTGDNSWLALLPDQTPQENNVAPDATPVSADDPLQDSSAFSQWNALTHTLTRSLPAGLATCRSARQRIREGG